MDKIIVKTKDLTPKFEVDGLDLTSQFKNIEKFYGIPATLHNVDKKFKTSTYLDVVKAATPELQLLVDGNAVQLLDPKSRYIEDHQFDNLLDMINTQLNLEVETSEKGFQKDAYVKLAIADDDNFLNDTFQRHWTLTRKPEGGTSLSTSIVRLACTNGMLVPEKQFSLQTRTEVPTFEAMQQMHATASLMNVSEYLESLFTDNGTPVPCSFADLLDMRDCLARLTNEDYASTLFPIERVKMFYQAQNIDTEKLARKWLDKLPTGLSYYQALQILTNGAKQMVEPTIDNQVKVAKFCAPKRMKNMKDTNLQWQGTPTFEYAEISHMMGDF